MFPPSVCVCVRDSVVSATLVHSFLERNTHKCCKGAKGRNLENGNRRVFSGFLFSEVKAAKFSTII